MTILLQVKINTITGKNKHYFRLKKTQTTTTLLQVKINTVTGKNKHYYRKKTPRTAWCISIAFDTAKIAYSLFSRIVYNVNYFYIYQKISRDVKFSRNYRMLVFHEILQFRGVSISFLHLMFLYFSYRGRVCDWYPSLHRHHRHFDDIFEIKVTNCRAYRIYRNTFSIRNFLH